MKTRRYIPLSISRTISAFVKVIQLWIERNRLTWSIDLRKAVMNWTRLLCSKYSLKKIETVWQGKVTVLCLGCTNEKHIDSKRKKYRIGQVYDIKIEEGKSLLHHYKRRSPRTCEIFKTEFENCQKKLFWVKKTIKTFTRQKSKKLCRMSLRLKLIYFYNVKL